MSNYELAESYDIDDGSLSNLPADVCFTLGAEWATFRARVMSGEQFTCLCLSENANRIAKLAERHGRFVEHHEHSPGWTQIIVGRQRD